MPIKNESIKKIRDLFSPSTNIKIVKGNRFYNETIIGEMVKLGKNNTILPGTIIIGNVKIGNDNIIGPYTTIGTPAQHRTYYDKGIAHNKLCIKIGNQNVLREYVTVHSPTVRDTIIKDDCFFMAYSHVPHDAVIGTGVTLTNGTQIAGHSTIMDYVNIGLNTAIHQYTTIGPYSIVGMGSIVTKDIPPFVKYRNFECFDINKIGMERNGFNKEETKNILDYYTKKTKLHNRLNVIMQQFQAVRNKGRTLAKVNIVL